MKIKSVLTAAVVALGTSGAAFAADNAASDAGEMKAMLAAKVSAADAASAVEAKGNGKVVELTLMDDGAAPAYRVSLLQSDGKELTFLVDAMSGAVAQGTDVSDNDHQSASENDDGEAGEGPNDADSDNEDAD